MVKEVKQLIRMGGVDIPGHKSLYYALRSIKGVGYSLSNAICNILNKNVHEKIGDMTDEDIKKVESILSNPAGYGVPSWMLNRRRDFISGVDGHLTGPDLMLRHEFDIKRLKGIKSYRGIRHAQGQPVRGQRTRSHFRHGQAVGVKRKGGTKKGKV